MIAIYYPENCRPHPSKAPVVFSSPASGVFVTLKNGANEITEKQEKALNAHPDFAKYLGWGAIQLIKSENAIASAENPESLLDYSLEDQKQIIAFCVDPELLAKWRDETRNQKVKSIIQLRIAAVNEGR
jgi:hypothetical protein